MKKIISALTLLLIGVTSVAQSDYTLISKGETSLFQKKEGGERFFAAGGKTYFFTDYYESPIRHYHMECFDEKGLVMGETELIIPLGVLNNSYDFRHFVGLGDHAYTLIEHLDKPAGKLTLLARKINPIGAVATEEVELIDYPFEKTLNSGYTYAATSKDQQKLAVAGLLPYVKGESAHVKIALFDKDLKSIGTGEFTIPGEDTKNKRIQLDLANDGNVFITKYENTKDRGVILTVFKWDPKTGELSANYECAVTADFRISTYSQGINETNELVIAGAYYEFKNFTAGDPKQDGVFYFSTNGNANPNFEMSAFAKPIPNLEIQQLVFNGNTTFLGGAELKTVRIDPPSGSVGAAALDYNYNYIHGNEWIFGFSAAGTKKFELTFDQSFSATNFDQKFRAGYAVFNGNFVLIYNDLGSKYMDPRATGYRPVIPVLVEISNDGLVKEPLVFTEQLNIPYAYDLLPFYAIPMNQQEVVMLMRSQVATRYVKLKIGA